MVVVNIDLHHRPINQLLYGPGGGVHNLIERTTAAVETSVTAECPIGMGDRGLGPGHSGDMRRSIGSDIDVHPGRAVVGRVYSTDEAALWVNEGTGVYGPRGTPLRSRRPGGRLRWPDRRGAPGYVYRSSVRGQVANDFFWRGLRWGTSLSFQEWRLKRYIGK